MPQNYGFISKYTYFFQEIEKKAFSSLISDKASLFWW